ncbi:MAG: hypothetical protein HWN65_23310 [Candidatus Helarchaeota archaeon]|nr:hypothetical protein [Candidatus Helarchaeota archaeon]
MGKYYGLERAKSLLDDYFTTQLVNCPHFAGDRACVTCDSRKECTTIESKIKDFGVVRLTVVGNSAMLSVVLPLKTDIEQFMWEKLNNSLQEEPDLLIRKPEEGFDLTFYTKFGQPISENQQYLTISKILDYLSENPWIQAKMLINKWIKETTEKLHLAIRRKLPKVALKKAPKIERSKIFERKHKALIVQASSIKEEKIIEEELEPIQDYAPDRPTEPSPPISEEIEPIQDYTPDRPIEPSPPISEEFVKRSKTPKQPFFLTAKERENEYAMWPPNIKRKKPGEEEPVTIEIPSVSEAVKKIGPEKPTIDESHIPKGDEFELKIFEKKQVEDKPLPPMPTDEPLEILTYLEDLVKKDYEMKKMADLFEQGMESIRSVMFYTDFLGEMSKVSNMLRRAEPGLTLSEHERRDILTKMTKWKSSPIWKSSMSRRK